LEKKIKGFKIDEKLWNTFKAHCLLKGISVEEELTSLIKEVIKNDPNIIKKT